MVPRAASRAWLHARFFAHSLCSPHSPHPLHSFVAGYALLTRSARRPFLNQTWDKSSGLLHPNATLNPSFANYHRVLLWYCDGASFAGSVEKPVTTTSNGTNTTLWFRGRAVLVSLLAKLKKDYGLGKAKQVLLAGCSAGGMSTYLHADFVKTQIASPTLTK